MINQASSPKLLLVADRRSAGSEPSVVVRRFRLARLPVTGRVASASNRPQAKRS
ncbi:MAG: hypothetical protein ABSH51_11975 [Solirubrobacteraceae bacterium]